MPLHKSQMLQGLVYIPLMENVLACGMLSTKRYVNLANTFHHARDSGYHNQVIPPPKDLNSELVGLLSYKKECTSKIHE